MAFTRIRLEGHLTRAALEVALAGANLEAPKGGRLTPLPGKASRTVLIDCRQMTDYDLDARHAFVAWLKAVRPDRLAILTDRELWHLVIRTMSLASGVPLSPFLNEQEAIAWLERSRRPGL